MKKGDKLPIAIGGVEVGFAEVESFNDGQVTLYVPAQRAQASVRMQLEAPPVQTPASTSETQTVITGVDRAVPTVVESVGEPVVETAVEAPVTVENNSGAPVATDVITTPEATSTPATEVSNAPAQETGKE